MKIPDKVKIGGHWFDIQLRAEKDGLTLMGQQQRWFNRIDIQADMSQSKQEATLFHETLHEIDCQHGLNLNEQQISSIAENFYQFLTDNGLLKP